jgi:hypothetical protein
MVIAEQQLEALKISKVKDIEISVTHNANITDRERAKEILNAFIEALPEQSRDKATVFSAATRSTCKIAVEESLFRRENVEEDD